MNKPNGNGWQKWLGAIIAIALAGTGAVFAYGALSAKVEHNAKTLDKLDRTKADRAVMEQIQQTNERDHSRLEGLVREVLREVKR